MPSQPWPPKDLALLRGLLLELRDAVADDERQESLTVNERMWLTRFLVVRATGYLEQVFFDCVREHVRARSRGTVQSFAMSFLTRSQNPSADNLSNMFGRIDPSLQRELKNRLDEDGGACRESLRLLVNTRHQIAHGLNESIRRETALELTEMAIDLAGWIMRRLDPNSSDRTRGAAIG